MGKASSCLCVALFLHLAWKVVASAKFIGMVELDSNVRDLQWVGESDEVVFAISDAGHLWRSHDGGVSWEDQSLLNKLEGCLDDPPAGYGRYEPLPGVAAMHVHPQAQNQVFFRSAADHHWITTDYGETYTKVQGPAGHIGLMTVRLHPTEINWILLTARRWACWTAGQSNFCADDLFVTKDFGRSWTNLTEAAQGRIISFVDFDWGWSKDPNTTQHSNTYTKETILASVYESRPEVEQHLRNSGASPVQQGWDRYVDFVRSHDLFKTPHQKAVPCGNQFEILNNVVFLAVASHCGDSNPPQGGLQGVRLFLSKDYGGVFHQACIPDTLTEEGYSVVEVTDDAVYLNVDYLQRARGAAQFGTTYVSDSNLTLFSVGMRRTKRSGAAVDFSRVQGVPGVYISNQLTSDGGDSLPGGGHRKHQGGARTGGSIVTRISFNGGVNWEPLTPPEKDSTGRAIECRKGGCNLHLHGMTSWEGLGSIPGYAFVYSHKSAPGVVMATGNVGRYLYQDAEVNTYLSPDAGQSWLEVAKGAFIYEFGDHGGIIVMAKHYLQGSTNEIMYSLNEGLDWSRAKFTEDPVDVYNIRVEPDMAGRRFILQGLTAPPPDTAGARKGVIIPVDFSQDASFKLCDASAYEQWSASATRCLLGQNVTITRQKRGAVCWNGKAYNRPPMTSQPCMCTNADFECDFGSERQQGKCRKFENVPEEACPILYKGKYGFSKTHERLIAGDKCANPHLESGTYKEGSFDEDDEDEGGMSILATMVIVVVGIGVLAAGVLAFMIQQGRIPESLLQHLPYLNQFRYQSMRTNFESLADDFGLVLGEDETEEQ